MAETFGVFENLTWNETLFDVQDLYLLLIDGTAINYNEYNQRTGVITPQPIPVSTAGSASDDVNKRIYLVTSASNLAIYNITTKAFIANLTVTPNLVGGTVAGAFNPSDGLLYILSNTGGVVGFQSVDPNTGARGAIVNKPTLSTSGGTGLGISPDGRFYWPESSNAGGGQWLFEMYSWTLAQPTPVVLLSQLLPNPLLSNNGATWQIDNKIYMSDAALDILWSYDIDTNTIDTTTTNITNANSMGAYTLGPVPGNCFHRAYKQELDGSVSFVDTDFDGNEYTLEGGANCDPIGIERSYLTQDRVFTTGDTITFPSNTLRSIYVQTLSGTADVNGVTIPTASVFEVNLPNRVLNQLGAAYTIDNITGTTYLLTTRYV